MGRAQRRLRIRRQRRHQNANAAHDRSPARAERAQSLPDEDETTNVDVDSNRRRRKQSLIHIAGDLDERRRRRRAEVVRRSTRRRGEGKSGEVIADSNGNQSEARGRVEPRRFGVVHVASCCCHGDSIRDGGVASGLVDREGDLLVFLVPLLFSYSFW